MSHHSFTPKPGTRVLIANRGEIARRIIRTLDRLGVESVAVYGDPDADAPHVVEATSACRLGPADLAESYLSIPNLLEAAAESGATHVHPGYGFLAERPEFAREVLAAGLVWIGPSPEAIDAMGSKINARDIAVSAGVPIIPGYNASQDPDDLRAAASEIGYPVLIKASAGGGGKGIRIVTGPDDFAAALDEAGTEAERAFGDGAVIVERFVQAPRHIEVQVIGDSHGTVVDLGTRECSVQRRYQKVLEEAPAPNLSADRVEAIRGDARSLASAMHYESAGTVEFVVDGSTGEHFFLEMNTRIQVEHTVTEAITGVDLVEAQLAVADGHIVPVAADAFDNADGVAFEARITTEDPWAGHVPQTGTITGITGVDDNGTNSAGLRWDSAVEAGSVISPHYDSMIGKLIVHAPDRARALDRLGRVLAEIRIEGVTTNIGLHRWLLEQPEVRTGRVNTRFLDTTPLPQADPYATEVDQPWGRRGGWRAGPHRSEYAFDSPARDHRWDDDSGPLDHGAGDVRAPFPGLITEVTVSAGDVVEPGQVLATIEAMKMLHPIVAIGGGQVASVAVEAGAQVGAGDLLIAFASEMSSVPEAPSTEENP